MLKFTKKENIGKMKYVEEKNMPREKMLYSGVESLSDIELIMALLGSGYEGKSVDEVALDVYKKINGNLYELEGKRPEEFFKESHYNEKVEGIGVANACMLIAAAELGKRILAGKKRDEVLDLNNPEAVAQIFKSNMRSLAHEEFHVLLLNSKLQKIGYEKVSSGGVASACADPSKVYLSAIKRGARAIIVAHNHPSGDPTPSKPDEASTSQLKAAGKIIGIELLDHIIIAGDKWFSFVQGNLLK